MQVTYIDSHGLTLGASRNLAISSKNEQTIEGGIHKRYMVYDEDLDTGSPLTHLGFTLKWVSCCHNFTQLVREPEEILKIVRLFFDFLIQKKEPKTSQKSGPLSYIYSSIVRGEHQTPSFLLSTISNNDNQSHNNVLIQLQACRMERCIITLILLIIYSLEKFQQLFLKLGYIKIHFLILILNWNAQMSMNFHRDQRDWCKRALL